LVERSLKQIDDKKEYQAVIAKTATRAKKRATEIDTQIKKGETVGRLAGVPFIAKDNLLAFGADTTAASNILKGFDAPYQATAIELLEAEGAICVAKANLDAFGHGGSTENSDFFVTKNPHDKSRVAGGSSGGSAAAVILDMAPFAIGTDTGGSIRQPASFCGAVGYKPTYGLVSRSGVIAMASSTDTIGPLARTVEDVALVLDVMSGKDALDSTTIERDHVPYTQLDDGELKGLKVGVIKEYYGEGISDEVETTTKQAIAKLEKAGAKVKEINIPTIDLALACYYIVVPAEISSNLSRYDGQKYGYSYKQAKGLRENYEKTRSEGFGSEAKRRIMIGTFVLSSGYYNAYYGKAQAVRTKLIEDFEKVFKDVDILVGPTAPTPAFKIGKHTSDPIQMYLADVMTVAPSLVGLPAVSVPCKTSEMPIGLQLIAPQKADRKLLTIAAQAERIIS
jgi:aspartyl-tRNA(Asn)/glutamyl-tRNA(Gln) amidotransferase subunit A